MPKAVNPQPRENLLKSQATSPMQFMKEYLLFDSEKNSLVRFRGPFIMPSWAGVEDNESEYVVDNSWTTLQQIANEVYGDPLLEFVISARNHMDLADAQMYKGKKLKVPNKDWVEDTLLPQGRALREAD
jgi:hypothetical protein